MRFLEYLRRSETDHGRLGMTFDDPQFGSDGASEVGLAPADRLAQRYTGSHYQEAMDKARRIIFRAMEGDRWAALRLQEAMTTSDFPFLFGDVLDRSVLANYAETPYTWSMFAKRATISDLRLARIFRVDHGAAILDGPIIPNPAGTTPGTGPKGLAQVTEYPQSFRTDSGYTDQLFKFGRRMDFSFETIINDDLDALKDTPALFGRAARRTEEKRCTKLYATTTGPNTGFFNTANKNVINPTVLGDATAPTNPPFSIDALRWAILVFSNQRDKDGEPISIEDLVLVYGPNLRIDVENVLGAKELWVNNEGGNIAQNAALNAMTSGVRMVVANWAAKYAVPALNYYLPIVDTTSGSTSWYLFAKPTSGRPALQMSFLRGREMPQLFMRLPNQVAIGEGSMGPGNSIMTGTANTNPLEGDFETDGVDYKIRHFIGGTLLDPVCAVASTGTGVTGNLP